MSTSSSMINEESVLDSLKAIFRALPICFNWDIGKLTMTAPIVPPMTINAALGTNSASTCPPSQMYPPIKAPKPIRIPRTAVISMIGSTPRFSCIIAISRLIGLAV